MLPFNFHWVEGGGGGGGRAGGRPLCCHLTFFIKVIKYVS